MRYLLDSGPLTAYLRGRRGAVTRFGPLIQQHDIATSAMCYGEVIEAIQSFPTSYIQYRANLQSLIQQHMPMFIPDFAIMEQYADIRRTMRPLRTPQGQPVGLIGDVDTIIAATALVHNLTIITIDSDFLRVPGLSVQLLTRTDLRQ